MLIWRSSSFDGVVIPRPALGRRVELLCLVCCVAVRTLTWPSWSAPIRVPPLSSNRLPSVCRSQPGVILLGIAVESTVRLMSWPVYAAHGIGRWLYAYKAVRVRSLSHICDGLLRSPPQHTLLLLLCRAVLLTAAFNFVSVAYQHGSHILNGTRVSHTLPNILTHQTPVSLPASGSRTFASTLPLSLYVAIYNSSQILAIFGIEPLPFTVTSRVLTWVPHFLLNGLVLPRPLPHFCLVWYVRLDHFGLVLFRPPTGGQVVKRFVSDLSRGQ